MSSPPESGFSRRGFLGVALGGAAAASTLRPEALAADPPPSNGAVALQTTVNGVPWKLDVHPDETALELVREKLGLRGAKEGCGHGACGACTLHLDGRPVAGCLTPATALEGRQLRTVEGLGPALHPVQQAFLGRDAFQCGYCTPGMVMASVAFYERWTAEKGPGQRPSDEEVAAALGGNLCRCAAYEGIRQAVGEACAGLPASPPVRVEGEAKVRGAAVYTVDVALEGMLQGLFLRSPLPAARIKRIDAGPALAQLGVKAFVPFLKAGDELRFAGQEVGALAAVDRRSAEEGLRHVILELDPLPFVTGIDAARKPGAPQVYGPERVRPPNSSEAPALPVRWEGNLRGPVRASGLMKEKEANAAIEALKAGGPGKLVEGTWRTQVQVHSALEPHAAVARWAADQKSLEIWLSTQSVAGNAEDIAERFDLPVEKVRLRAEHVGGGFGAKATLKMEAIAAIELARAARAPVRVALSREEELCTGGLRPGAEMHFTVGADAKGEQVAMKLLAYGDGGVSMGSSLGLGLRLIYLSDQKELVDFDVATHGPPGAPMRGPGGPPMLFALEQAMDMMARARGEDGVVLRRRWDKSEGRRRLYDAAEKVAWWGSRSPMGADKGRFRKGVGMASSVWPCFVQPNTRVELVASPQGRYTLRTATADIGNGGRTVILHAAAAALGVEASLITVELGDSAHVGGPMVGGSRSTSSLVPAVEDAVHQLAEELKGEARSRMGIKEAERAPGGLKYSRGLIPWSELLAGTGGIKVIGKRPRDDGGYFLPVSVADTNASRALASGVQLVEVEVDTRLGKIRATRAWSGIHAGVIRQPVLARSQVKGGVIQGLGYALYEERLIDPGTGRLATHNLEDYRIPGMGDIPEMEVHFDEGGFETVPGRSVGIAELATVAVSGAVANAVFHATGWRPMQLPLRADRVLQGVKA